MYFRYLGLLLALPTFAQYADLAVTDDGQQLYFATTLAPAIQSRTGGHAEYRIFRWTPTSIGLFAQRGELAPKDSWGSGDGAVLPQVSGNGEVTGFTLRGCARSRIRVRGSKPARNSDRSGSTECSARGRCR